MEKGLKQFDKYITPEDLLGTAFLFISEDEDDGVIISKTD